MGLIFPQFKIRSLFRGLLPEIIDKFWTSRLCVYNYDRNRCYRNYLYNDKSGPEWKQIQIDEYRPRSFSRSHVQGTETITMPLPVC